MSFLNEFLTQRLMKMKTHPKAGDMAIMKIVKTSHTRTGDLQPARIPAEAKADGSARLYAKPLPPRVAYWRGRGPATDTSRALATFLGDRQLSHLRHFVSLLLDMYCKCDRPTRTCHILSS